MHRRPKLSKQNTKRPNSNNNLPNTKHTTTNKWHPQYLPTFSTTGLPPRHTKHNSILQLYPRSPTNNRQQHMSTSNTQYPHTKQDHHTKYTNTIQLCRPLLPRFTITKYLRHNTNEKLPPTTNTILHNTKESTPRPRRNHDNATISTTTNDY